MVLLDLVKNKWLAPLIYQGGHLKSSEILKICRDSGLVQQANPLDAKSVR